MVDQSDFEPLSTKASSPAEPPLKVEPSEILQFTSKPAIGVQCPASRG